MLGNWIGPIEWTLVIRQVARQPLPRVIPEKTCIEVSHCYRQDQDTHLYLLEHSTDGLTPYSCDTLVIGLALQSALADWWCLHWIPEPADSSVYSMSAHSHLLEPQSSQAMSSPLPGNSPSLTSVPFRPFASINDYIFADEHI